MNILSFFASVLTLATFILSFLFSKYVEKHKRHLVYVNLFTGIFASSLVSSSLKSENLQTMVGILGLIITDFFTLNYIYKAYKKVQSEEAEPLRYKENIEARQREKEEEKKANKKKIIIGFSVAFVFIGISFIFVTISHNKYKDTNGVNNFNLQHISDEQIINGLTGITKTNYQIHSSGEKTGIENYSDFDREHVSISVDRLSGVELVQTTKATTNNIEITADTKVESGNFRLVVVIDKEIYKDFVINTKDTIKIKNCKDKEIFVYIVGENAKFEAIIERELYNS